MNTAVVKLYTLTNPVRTAAQYNNLVTIRWVGFTFIFVGGIHIGG